MQARSNGTKRPAMLDYEADCNKSVSVSDFYRSCICCACAFYISVLNSIRKSKTKEQAGMQLIHLIRMIEPLLNVKVGSISDDLHSCDFKGFFFNVVSDDRLERQRESLDNIFGDCGSRAGSQWGHITQVR